VTALPQISKPYPYSKALFIPSSFSNLTKALPLDLPVSLSFNNLTASTSAHY